MSREIKFRAWIEAASKMASWEQILKDLVYSDCCGLRWGWGYLHQGTLALPVPSLCLSGQMGQVSLLLPLCDSCFCFSYTLFVMATGAIIFFVDTRTTNASL